MSRAEHPLLILGTSIGALQVADLARDAGHVVEGFVENLDRARAGEELDGLPIHWVDDIRRFVTSHHAICGISTTVRGRFTDHVEKLGMDFATVIHPSAQILRHAEVGSGCVIGPGAIIARGALLDRHVFVNRAVLIGHDTKISSYVSIQPGANIAGLCSVGEATYVGMGAVVINKMTIGKGCVVGAGAVVTADLPDRVLAVGVPAKVVKEDVEPR